MKNHECSERRPYTMAAHGGVSHERSMARGAIAAVSALALLCAYAMPPVPVAEWEGDFNVTTKNSYTLVVGTGNTVAADGSTITIGSSEGVRVFWPSADSSYTVVVRYSDMTVPSASAGAVLAGHAGGSSSGLMMTSAGKVNGMYLGKKWNSVLTDYPLPEGSSGCYAMAVNISAMRQTGSNGQVLYVKTADGEWTHHYTNAGAGYSAKDKLNTGCVVAGPCPDVEYAYVPTTMTGMKIEAIAVFSDDLKLEELAGYRFPSEVCSVEISSSGSSAWADLPWRDGIVPVGDIGDKAVKVVCNAPFTITDSSLAVTAAVMVVSGSGTLTFAGATEFGTKYDSSIELNLATSGDGALTLVKGDWYLGRQVAGYKEFTIAGTNPFTLGTNATLVIYNGRVGSPVAGYGTIRSVDLFPRANELDVALQNEELWHGNCVLEEIDNINYQNVLNPDNYGNNTSKLTFNGVTNKFFKFVYPLPAEDDIPIFKPELAVKNHTKLGGIGLGIRAGGTTVASKIKKLSGDGDIVNMEDGSTAQNSNQMLYIHDWSSFTGSFRVFSNMRIIFGSTLSGVAPSRYIAGSVVIRSGAPLSLGPLSKIHARRDTSRKMTVEGTLSVVSGRALCGGMVDVLSGGELIFDADKAQDVSDATLTDCSAEDMSKISGDGLVRFKGTYSPFILPSVTESNLVSSLNIRVDGATINGDLSVASRFGGDGTYGGGTLTLLNGAVLDLTLGTITLADTANLAAPPAQFTVAAANHLTAGEVKLFSGSAIPASWQGLTVKVGAPDGSDTRRFLTVLRADGLYAVLKGMTISFR